MSIFTILTQHAHRSRMMQIKSCAETMWVLPVFLSSWLCLFGPGCLYGQVPDEKPITPQDRKHWAFQPITLPIVPSVANRSLVRNPIDAFIVARLEASGIQPAPPANKIALLRRVTFDLIGLPPTPDEIEAFLNDHRSDAYERVVERLLASPHYGERWAQHWLDVVRYAESNGFEGDAERPNAWRYRDYVIRSFNEDKSFDRFLTEQLAGDELAVGKDVRTHADLWIATGMHRCGPIHVVSGNTDPEVNRQEVLTEMVHGIGAAFLGLTMNCARCHDHKFDPISQGDYYRLEAFFASVKPRDVDYSTPAERSAFQKTILDLMVQITAIKGKVAAIDAPVRAKLREAKQANLDPDYKAALAIPAAKRSPVEQKLAREAEILLKVTWDEILAVMSEEDRRKRAMLREQQHALEARLPNPPNQAWAIVDDGQYSPTYVLKRGDVKRKIARVEPAFIRVLQPGVSAIGSDPRQSFAQVVGGMAQPAPRLTRLELAHWLTDPKHPLTARVFVNRLWQHHFGRGIVATPNDFGIRGEKPTHPELLDYLAFTFIQRGWKIKDLHRLMVLSNTYRQSSRVSASETAEKIDPDNRLLWKMNRRRLEAESLRDAILCASGALNRELGGPMVRIPLEPEVYDLIFTEGEPDGLWHVTPDVRQHFRRSIYLFAKRNVRLPLLEAFDQPDRLSPCAERPRSTFAPQALILFNGPFSHVQSRTMASRLLTQFPQDPRQQIEYAYQCCLARKPTAEEIQLAAAFLEEQADLIRDRLRMRLRVDLPEQLPPQADLAHAVALADMCLALFNTNEFVYIP